MNIWGKLFLIVLAGWLFTEYLRYVKYRLLEIAKEYQKLQEMRNEFLEKYMKQLQKVTDEKQSLDKIGDKEK